TYDCRQEFLPESVQGEGIGFAWNPFNFYLFDLASQGSQFYCSPAGARSYGLAPGRCADVQIESLIPYLEFNSASTLPFPLCAVKLEPDGIALPTSPRLDITLVSVDASSAVLSALHTRSLAFDFAPGQTGRFDISSLVGGSDARLSLTVTDGNTLPVTIDTAVPYQGETTLVLESNTPPRAVINTSPSVKCGRPGGAEVTLDASGSTDPDSSPGTNDDIASFEWFENPGQPGQSVLGSGRVLNTTLPLGTHIIGLVVTDSKGATDAAQTAVTVRDSTPPVLVCPVPTLAECSRVGGSQITVVATASDVCSPAVTV